MSQLGDKVDVKLLERCSFTNEQLCSDLMSPDSTSPILPNDSLNNPASHCQVAFSDILNYNDLEKEYTSDDWDKYFATQLPSALVDVSEISMDVSESTIDAADQSLDIETSVEEVSNVLQSEIDNAAYNFVRGTSCDNSNSSNKCKPSDLVVDQNANVMLTETPSSVEVSDTNSIVSVDDDVLAAKVKKSSTKTKKARKRNKKNDNRAKPSTELDNQKLSDIIAYKCAYCPEYCTSLESIHEHWKKSHGIAKRSTFMFQIARSFQCYYCRQCCPYDKLKAHCQSKHRSTIDNPLPFAMVDKLNPNKCGLCIHQFDMVGPEIVDHFDKFHNVEKATTIQLHDYLTDELLDRILADKIQFLSPENNLQQNQLTYGCSHVRCTERNVDKMEMVAHIRNHSLKFLCEYCDKQLDNMALFNAHHKIMHSQDAQAYRYVDVHKALDQYLDMKIIFSNNLLLTKRDCKQTRFGCMDAVIEKVQEIDDRELKVAALKRQQKATSVKAKKIKKKKKKQQ